MRKVLLNKLPDKASASEMPWLDLEQIAQVAITSEDPEHSIEAALKLESPSGWRASSPGPQTIRLVFDAPQSLRHVQLLFTEAQYERQQEFLLSWSAEEGGPLREIVRQQFHFSPNGAARELEDFKVELEGVRMVELTIIPNMGGGEARASLAHLRLV